MAEITYSSVTMPTDEYQARLTSMAHETIKYLARQGHLDEKSAEELLESVVVVPVANNTFFGRLRDYLFGKDTQEDKSIVKYIVTQIL